MGIFKIDRFFYLKNTKKHIDSIVTFSEQAIYVPGFKPERVASILVDPQRKYELDLAVSYINMTDSICEYIEDLKSDFSFQNTSFFTYLNKAIECELMFISNVLEYGRDGMNVDNSIYKRIVDQFVNILKEDVKSPNSDEYYRMCLEASLVYLLRQEELGNYVGAKVARSMVPKFNPSEADLNTSEMVSMNLINGTYNVLFIDFFGCGENTNSLNVTEKYSNAQQYMKYVTNSFRSKGRKK